ncbi:MAG: RDD family protein, partial [Mycobacteriales bacterium]
PGYGQPPPGYGQAPSYGQPPAGSYKGSQLGLPHTGPNSLASQWARLGARLLDGLILFVPAIIVYMSMGRDALDALEPSEMNLLSGGLLLPTLVWLAITAAYEIYFLVNSGATPGKKAVGIRVAKIADGTNPDPQSAAMRWAIASLPGLLPVVSLFGIVNVAWCLWDNNRQCLHDKPAKTVVVRT